MGGAAVVVGNPKSRSRTRAVAEEVMLRIVDCVGTDTKVTVIDLSDHASKLFDWQDPTLKALTAEVAQCDLLVVASPTYKATYTGLLKAFFDRYGTNGLCGVVAVPIMVGASPIHALAPEMHLRPLLVELGATVPARALYVVESDMDHVEEVVEKWAMNGRPLVSAALSAHHSEDADG
jgi:FMN reductase